jgi:ferrochelatase
LGAQRVRDVCVVPISFVSDHVETLGEIDHEARELAASVGIERFVMTAGLNTSPTFIRALGEMVLKAIGREDLNLAVVPEDEDFKERLIAVQ